MAKLPGVADLGGLPNVSGSRPVADVSDAGKAYGQAFNQLGAGLEKAGEGVGEYETAKERYDYTTANSAFTSDNVDLHSNLALDPNYSTAVDRYNTQATQIQQQRASQIGNPALQQRFIEATNDKIAQSRASLTLHSFEKGSQAQADDWLSDGDKKINQAVPADDATTGALIGSHLQRLNSMVDAGYVTPQWARQQRGQFVSRYATAAYGAMQPEDRAALFQKYDATTQPVGNGPQGTPAPSSGVSTHLPSDIDQMVTSEATRVGIDPNVAKRIVKLESGGDAGVTTGSYKGLFQLSDSEFRKYGSGNIFDAGSNIQAGMASLADRVTTFKTQYGRPPSATELYLAHQQGDAGLAAHLANPDAPAWENMASTGEGKQKGDNWAKKAIWGNIPTDMKAMFPGGVDSVTSGQFMALWAQKVEGIPYQQALAGANQGRPGGADIAPSAGGNNSQGGGLPPNAPTDISGQSVTLPAGTQQTTNAQLPSGRTPSGTILDFMNRDQQASLRAQNAVDLQNLQRAAEVDAARKFKENDEAAKRASDQSESKYISDIYSGNPQLTARDAANDPSLLPAAKQRMIAAIAAPRGEKDTSTYGTGFYNLFQRIHAPADDPSHIGDQSELFNHIGENGDLTIAGLEKLRAEIAGRNTPEGVAEGEMRKQFLANAKKQISGADPLLHIPDPKGEEYYLKFLGQFFPAYEKGKAAGKTATSMLTPDGPDYLGKSIAGFTRTPAQIAADIFAARNAEAPALSTTPAFDPTKIKTVDDAVQAYRAGNLTKQAADELAISRGWATRRKPDVTMPQFPHP